MEAWIKQFYPFLKDIEKLLNDNRIFRQRTVDIGVVSPQQALDWGFSGPMIRASGIPWDIRRSQPYEVYDRMDFEIPVGTGGDCYDRFMAGIILGYAQPGGIADLEAAAPELVLLLGADEVAPDRFKGAYKVYIGHHGDAGAKQADLVLPGASYAEKHGTYVNTEGRVQWSERAVFAPGEAREDWAILRAVSGVLGKPLPFDSYDGLRSAMIGEYPQLGRNGLVDLSWSPPKLDAKASGPIRYPVADFFLTNAICRNSPTMRRCSEELVYGAAIQEAAE